MADSSNNVHPGIASLRPYQPGKPVDELARELGVQDIVKLASNENPRGPGPLVRAAIEREMGELSRYPDGSGYNLKQVLATHTGVSMEQITLGNGSNDVLDLITRVCVEPGFEAVISAHSFVVYRIAVTCAGGVLVEVPAIDYGTDLEGMLAAITERTRAVFIANPNNPTGTWVNEDALISFLDAVPEQVAVVLDEAYLEYAALEPTFPQAIPLLDRYPNLLITRTFSKVHGLASLRVGYGITSPAYADLLNRARQPFNVNSIGLAAAAAALTDQEFVSESTALNTRGMTQVVNRLNELGLSHIPSLGNFVSFDCGMSGPAVYDALLHEGVIVRPIAEYGLPNHLRVTIGLEQENERFLQALEKVLKALASQ